MSAKAPEKIEPVVGPMDRRGFLRVLGIGGAISGAALGGFGVGRTQATHGGDPFQRLTNEYTDFHEVPVPTNPDGGVRRLFVDDATSEISVRTSGGATVSLEAAGAGGDNITVNGSAVVDANFNATNPAAPADGVNARFQLDTAATPDDISANIPVATPNTIAEGDTPAEGTAASVPRSDHRHGSPATWTPTAHGASAHSGDVIPAANQEFGAFYSDFGEIVVPANPGLNVRRLFVDSATGEISVRTNAGATVSLEAAGAGGDNITVNGTAATDANFNDTLPAAPADGVNVRFQIDTVATPDNVSANILVAVPNTIAEGDTPAAGSAASVPRSDHRHGSPATWTPSAHKATHISGGSDTFAKNDVLVAAAQYLDDIADPASDAQRIWIADAGSEIRYWDDLGVPISRTLVELDLTQTLTAKTLTTPTIASFVNATHDHEAAAGGGLLDHGLALAGSLGDDDHTQYILVDGTRAFTGKQTFDTPVAGNASVVFPTGVDPTTPVQGDMWLNGSDLKFRDATAVRTLVSQDRTETLTNKTLTQPTIGDFVNAQHAHAAAASGGTVDHADLANVLPGQHHAQSHVLATGTALGPDHTMSGAVAGEVLRALSATTAAFDVLQHADLGGVTSDLHHAQLHAAAHAGAAGDDIGGQNMTITGNWDVSGITGRVVCQTGAITPVHSEAEGTLYWDTAANLFFVNNDGATGWTQVGPGAAGAGDEITVNGVAATDADFDDATPAAPAGAVNVIWQKDAAAPDNISAHVAANAVVNTVLADMAANTVKARAAGTTGDPGDVAVGANTVLGRKGANIVAETIITAQIADDQVTFAKMQNLTTDRLMGRDTALAGDPEEITVGGGLEFTGSVGIQRSALTGDVTAPAGSNATTISANAVLDTMLRDSAAFSVIGRAAGTVGDPADIVAAADQVLAKAGAGNVIFQAVATAMVANDAITFAKMQDIATDRLVGRDTALAGDPEEITVAGGLEFTGAGGIQRSALTGDVTAPAGSGVTTIAANAVLDTMLRDSVGTSVIGRSAGTTGDPADIVAGADGEILSRDAGTLGFNAITFTISATVESPAVNDFVVWRAPFACTLTNLRAYQDTGTGSIINAFRGTLAAPTLFRATNYTILAADTWEDAGSLQNTAIAAGTAVYFRFVTIAGSPNELAIQLDITRP